MDITSAQRPAFRTLTPLGTFASLSPSFGRVARSYPVPAPAPVSVPAEAGSSCAGAGAPLARSLRRHGALATAAHLSAVALARASALARQLAHQWSHARQLRRTARAMAALGPRDLRDIGFASNEAAAIAAEAAREAEATRRRAWSHIGHRNV
ncbi:MAG: hypothetical protein JNJ89_08635 [Rubrivivax sp.]|nr:hypothetical protein [Rubrivivax sp.]